MRKICPLFLAIFIGVLAFTLIAPMDAEAKTIKKRFNNNAYSGTWEVTSDPCEPYNVGNTGAIYFQQLKLKKKGKLKTTKPNVNKVWFDNSSMKIRGKVYKKNGKFRVNFLYPQKSDSSGFEGHVTGKITQKKITGKYTHEYAGCTWKGNYTANRQYN
ncbi:MAG: hypothetical protein ABH835_00600 [Patescibacteria group bacterium]